jgi:hypothetical protein
MEPGNKLWCRGSACPSLVTSNTLVDAMILNGQAAEDMEINLEYQDDPNADKWLTAIKMN